jgi:peptidyl carrier protein
VSDINAISKELQEYVRTDFLDGDEAAELTETSPLLEWGVLNSLNIAQLISFVHQRYGVDIPPERITGKHFGDIRSIAGLVEDLSAARTG